MRGRERERERKGEAIMMMMLEHGHGRTAPPTKALESPGESQSWNWMVLGFDDAVSSKSRYRSIPLSHGRQGSRATAHTRVQRDWLPRMGEKNSTFWSGLQGTRNMRRINGICSSFLTNQ